MSRRRGYWERDSSGHERVVIVNHRRSSSQTRSPRELLEESESREQALIAQVSSLSTRLSYSERNEWALRQQHTALVHEHQTCRTLRGENDARAGHIRRLDEKLTIEEDRNSTLREKIRSLEREVRSLKRSVVPDYKDRYDTAMSDLDLVTQRLVEKNEELRLKDLRIEEKGRTIAYLRDFCAQRGLHPRY